MSLTLTTDERDLLRACHRQIAFAVAHPAGGIEHLRASRASGCGGGFDYQAAGGKLAGTWRAEGRTVVVSLTRIQRWAESLPDELVARARVAWAVHPVYTRDIPKLHQIVLEALDLDDAQQLDLFASAS